jgi:AraC family transcriptional regulator, ethanolamine operon transcriptional activator
MLADGDTTMIPTHATFNDIDEQAAALTGWNQRYEQLSRGAFHGEVRELRLSGVKLMIEDIHQAVHQTGWVNPQVLALGVPLILAGEARFCGQVDDATSLHVFSGREGFEFRSPKRHLMVCIEIDADLISPQGPAWGERAGLCAAPGIGELRRFLLGLFDLALQDPGAWQQRQPLRLQARDELLDRIEGMLAGDMADRAAASAGALQAGLAVRACDWAMQRLDEPPTIGDWCRALGVSRRTLQYCFEDTWQMAPKTWLNTLRLNAVRRELKTAESVTAAATRFGFYHFGHFAQHYQALFGERPSQTLRRHRGTGPVGCH